MEADDGHPYSPLGAQCLTVDRGGAGFVPAHQLGRASQRDYRLTLPTLAEALGIERSLKERRPRRGGRRRAMLAPRGAGDLGLRGALVTSATQLNLSRPAAS